ncbi:hypothetical protein MMC12_005042 [Toensbergia leucococca]|nr:hypothetical protein [Toensbergia leucococca]
MAFFKGLLECLTGLADNTTYERLTSDKATQHTYKSEKSNLCYKKPVPLSAQEAVARILSTLQDAEKPGRHLDIAVQDIIHQAGGVHTNGIMEKIANAVLAKLQDFLKEGSPMRQVMQDAYDKACDAATAIKGFAREHPVLVGVFCAVIALGILILLAPCIIHALGFSELGPIEGSFAAAWQSTYGGVVESGSLFSYLQKLGMLYK